jgi:plastocyanin
MTGRLVLSVAVALVAAAVAGGRVSTAPAPPQANVGTIKGRVRLAGPSPGNTVIRMGLDPMCVKVNAGKRVIQEEIVTSADGGLGNVFVRLQGSFPRSAPPAEPVTIDQRLCVYTPRVVGARVGQTLQVRNSDSLLHNVHSLSVGTNGFNIAQPMAGMLYQFQLKDEETMLRLTCDLHRWMRSYIGVVSHPYFAVSGVNGTFEIANVPVGMHTIQTWHERYGNLTRPVRVTAGGTAMVDFAYTGAEKPATRP